MRKPDHTLVEIRADHQGWEAEVEQVARDLDYNFPGLRHQISRYTLTGWDGRALAVGYETSSPEVLGRARKLRWLTRH